MTNLSASWSNQSGGGMLHTCTYLLESCLIGPGLLSVPVDSVLAKAAGDAYVPYNPRSSVIFELFFQNVQ